MNRSGVETLIRKADSIIVATLNESGIPECRAVFNLTNTKKFPKVKDIALEINEDGSWSVYIGTNTSSKKIAQLRKNNNCSLYFNVPDQIGGVNLIGTTEEILDIETKKKFWHTSWLMYYHKGVSDPDFTLLKFTSTHAKCWHNGSLHEF